MVIGPRCEDGVITPRRGRTSRNSTSRDESCHHLFAVGSAMRFIDIDHDGAGLPPSATSTSRARPVAAIRNVGLAGVLREVARATRDRRWTVASASGPLCI